MLRQTFRALKFDGRHWRLLRNCPINAFQLVSTSNIITTNANGLHRGPKWKHGAGYRAPSLKRMPHYRAPSLQHTSQTVTVVIVKCDVTHFLCAMRCVYSKFGLHPHPPGYLCAKCHFCGFHCWASRRRKNVYSITHPVYMMCREPKLVLWNKIFKQ